jgi:mycothiol synthase
MPARVGLDVSVRQPALAEQLVECAAELVRKADGERVRLFVSGRADWSRKAAGAAGFELVRTIAHMLLPADVPTPTTSIDLPGLTVRSIRKGEDQQVLAALNRAWTGTWNFVEITFEMLRRDLQGQRKGMLLAVNESGAIVATCHAVFDPTDVDPDNNPTAWISNLTVDSDYRGRGLARGMLAAGIAHLRSRGASSVTLGVDADNPAPFTLYRSVGFQIASSFEAWDKRL